VNCVASAGTSSKRTGRRKTLIRLGAVALAAIAVVAALVVVSQKDGTGTSAPSAGEGPAGVAEAGRLFAGIPQQGIALGNPDAPVTMVEFADLQCPFCGQYDREVLPTIVNRYVRTGQVRLELRLLSFIGPDSERAARVALAAAGQNRMWGLVDLLYRNQGTENSGYVTDAFLRRLARAAPGLEAERAMRESESAAVGSRLASARSAADRAGIDATPSFLLGTTGGRLAPFRPSALEPGAFTDRIDALLASG